jgi:hypothetical protein
MTIDSLLLADFLIVDSAKAPISAGCVLNQHSPIDNQQRIGNQKSANQQ